MYSDDEIDSAVAAGAISAEAAAALRAHVAAARRAPTVDEEHFRLISGFNDFFVALASGLFLGSMYWIGVSVQPWAGPLLVSVAAWLLSEFFVRKRRMALPGIVLLLSFVGGVFFTGLSTA